ncbi:chemosensory receptor A [Elysia marginata]|uniref:Chemosensory receptor A n=1 Tax=Elysia marginata TaxID=1093978 RepID=A0AAV4GNW4_9GAST|nr:chemosensory receptor A [Elysia marginata]
MDLVSIQTTTTFTIEPSPVVDLDLRPSEAKVKSIWMVDNHVKNAFTIWAMGCISVILCSIGTIGNIINVIVFCKMGFKETINISFIGLAIADIGCLVTQIWLGVQYIPPFRDLANWLLPFDPADPIFRNAAAAWPHICFLRITGLVTAHATLVRCLCIAMPLKIGVDYEAEQITFGISSGTGYVTFFVVILCTYILITNLRKKAKWREGVTGTAAAGKDGETAATGNKSGSGNVSKETKIIKLVVIISSVFIGSYFPSTVVFLAATAMADFGPTGKYQNLFFVACSFNYNLEAINSSVNILIYLNMSSKYKATFDAMFNRGENSAGISGRD